MVGARAKSGGSIPSYETSTPSSIAELFLLFFDSYFFRIGLGAHDVIIYSESVKSRLNSRGTLVRFYMA